MKTKLKRKSKTLWINAVMAGLAVVAANTEMLQQYLTPEYYQYVIGGMGIVNIVLRFFTDSSIRHVEDEISEYE